MCPVLKLFHWLSIEMRISSKTMLMVYEVLQISQPHYLHLTLTYVLQPCSPMVSLWPYWRQVRFLISMPYIAVAGSRLYRPDFGLTIYQSFFSNLPSSLSCLSSQISLLAFDRTNSGLLTCTLTLLSSDWAVLRLLSYRSAWIIIMYCHGMR